MSAGDTITIRLVRSAIGFSRRQKRTVHSLGFSRLQQVRTLPDNDAVRGMIRAVGHLVQVIEPAGKRSSR